MQRLLTIIGLLLPLFGCDPSRATFVHHLRSGGVDVIDARATPAAGAIELDCIATSSGRCHRTVMPMRCAAHGTASNGTACPTAGARRLVLAPRHRYRLDGVAAAGLCGARSAALRNGACTLLDPRRP